MNKQGVSQPPADQATKDMVVRQVREGVTVQDASATCGYSVKTIHRWVREAATASTGVGFGTESGPNLILENARLKKENEQLYNLLGRATAEMKLSKR